MFHTADMVIMKQACQCSNLMWCAHDFSVQLDLSHSCIHFQHSVVTQRSEMVCGLKEVSTIVVNKAQ